MKKWVIFTIIPIILLIAGCESNKIDITNTEFDVKSCNKYFKLVDCILDNDVDETIDEEMRNELRQEIKDMQNSWKDLSDDELDTLCSEELARFESNKSSIDEIGCSID